MAELQEKNKQKQQEKEDNENNSVLEDEEEIPADIETLNTSNEIVVEK